VALYFPHCPTLSFFPFLFFLKHPPPPASYTLSLHDALPISVLRTPTLSCGPKLREFEDRMASLLGVRHAVAVSSGTAGLHLAIRSEEHTSELQSPDHLVCRLLLEKKKI